MNYKKIKRQLTATQYGVFKTLINRGYTSKEAMEIAKDYVEDYLDNVREDNDDDNDFLNDLFYY